MPNQPHSRRVSASLRRLTLGALLGAAVGATAGWSVAAALQSGDEGAGYGGTANALQVEIVGEEVRVSGVGFLASSAVEVQVGDLSTTVTADEFGRIDSTVVAGADGTPDNRAVAAMGTAGDGSLRSLRPQAPQRDDHGVATVLGAGLGAVPVVLSRRKYVRVR